MVKAIIFDVDGTLIYVDLHARAWQEIFLKYGVTTDFQAVRAQIGKGGDKLMKVFLPEEQIARSVYSMPPNVEACQILPLWGVKEAGWANGLFSETYRRKARTTSTSLRKEFLGPFREAVRGLVTQGDPESLAENMAVLNEYFQHCDYNKAMTRSDSSGPGCRQY